MFAAKYFQSPFSTLPVQPASSYTGRTFIVTGANSGLGFQCAKHLVEDGAARVILAVRSMARGEEAMQRIEAGMKRKGIAEVWELDLASYTSVKAFANRATAELDRIDALVENAGIAYEHQWVVAEGNEISITVNVISTYLLAALLLPKLRASAVITGVRPHLVIVTSEMALTDGKGLLEMTDGSIIDYFNSEGQSPTDVRRYAAAKLMQCYATRQLASLLSQSHKSVVVNYVNPGFCVTSFSRHSTLSTRLTIRVLGAFIARTAEMGSRTLLHAATGGLATHGKYLTDCSAADASLPLWLTNDNGRRMQDKVWNEIVDRLERIEPGCVHRALSKE